MMSKVYLSVQEAEELLPTIEKKIRNLLALEEEVNLMRKVKVKNAAHDLEDYLLVLTLKQQYHEKLHVFYRDLAELTKMGCVVKDLRKGLVDFYSKRGSNDILLCWKMGEPGIMYWHDIQSGYATRQPVEILKAEYQRELGKYK